MTYYCKLTPSINIIGGYGVKFPDFYCCVSQGDNKEHALEMAKEVLLFQLECDLDEGCSILEPVNYDGYEEFYPIEVNDSLVKRILDSQKKRKYMLRIIFLF